MENFFALNNVYLCVHQFDTNYGREIVGEISNKIKSEFSRYFVDIKVMSSKIVFLSDKLIDEEKKI